MAKKDKKTKKQMKKGGKREEARAKAQKKQKKSFPECHVHVEASFNNTLVTITDPEGNVLSSSSPGAVGFKGSKKSTAFAATRAAQDAVSKAQKYGIREAKVYIKGPGPGRNAAVKGLDSEGLKVTLLSDLTPIPHNGCRARKKPRK